MNYLKKNEPLQPNMRPGMCNVTMGTLTRPSDIMSSLAFQVDYKIGFLGSRAGFRVRVSYLREWLVKILMFSSLGFIASLIPECPVESGLTDEGLGCRLPRIFRSWGQFATPALSPPLQLGILWVSLPLPTKYERAPTCRAWGAGLVLCLLVLL